MNKVSEKIINDALAKAKEIEEKLIEDIDELKKLQKTEAEKLKNKYSQRLEKIYNTEYKKLISQINLKNRSIILSEKRKIINDMVNFLIEELKEDKTLYIKFLKALIIKGTVTGKEEIIIPEKDKDLYSKEFLSDIKEKIENKFSVDFTIKTGDIKLGLILKEGRIEFNASVDNTIQYIFEEYEIEISNILF